MILPYIACKTRCRVCRVSPSGLSNRVWGFKVRIW